MHIMTDDIMSIQQIKYFRFLWNSDNDMPYYCINITANWVHIIWCNKTILFCTLSCCRCIKLLTTVVDGISKLFFAWFLLLPRFPQQFAFIVIMMDTLRKSIKSVFSHAHTLTYVDRHTKHEHIDTQTINQNQ